MAGMAKTARFLKVGGGAWQTALCEKAAQLHEAGRRVYVRAPSRAEAQGLDDLLWTFREDSFVPHSLWLGEAPLPDPVAVGWLDGNPNGSDVLLLGGNVEGGALLAAVEGFDEVVDFIPETDPAGTQAARDRYRALREAGWALEVAEAKKR